MSPDHDSPLPTDHDPDDELPDEGAYSIFRTMWVRVVLVVVGVALVSAVAVPFVIDAVNPAPPPLLSVSEPRQAPTGATPVASAATASSAASVAEKSTPAAAPVMKATPAPVATAAPTDKSAPVMKATPAPAPTAPAPKVAETAKPTTPVASKAPAPAKDDTAQKTAAPALQRTAALTTSTDVPRERGSGARPKATRPTATDASDAPKSGDYFVQVGAYKDRETARRVAATLREQNYRVDESTIHVGGARPATESPRPAPKTSTGMDRYDVIVSGGSPADINTKLAAKGLASEAVGDSVRIRPSLSLRDAVALSKDLNNEGFKVQVRRGDGAGPAVVAMATPPRTSEGGSETLYRVRVGGYADKPTALSVARALEGKGYTPFIARGRE